jgi:sugar phosphate isomerase/epimerase
MPTRRHFLQWAAAGTAAAMAARNGLAADADPQPPAAKPHTARKYELGLASFSFRKFPLDQALAMTNRVALKHICLKDVHLKLTSTPEQIAEAAAQVKAAGIDLYGCGVITMRKTEDVDKAFDYAKAAGMRVIVAMPSVQMLPPINEAVQKYDIRLAIHNHGPGDRIFPTPDLAYEKIKDLDRRVGLCIDIGHTVRIGGDPYRAAEQFADRLFDIHMKDVTAAKPEGKEIECGRGIIDIPRFLRVLDKVQYAGYVSFEHENDEKDPLPGLAESVGYVRGVMAVI